MRATQLPSRAFFRLGPEPAIRFGRVTGVDAIAVAVGNVRDFTEPPQLDLNGWSRFTRLTHVQWCCMPWLEDYQATVIPLHC